MKRLLSLSNRLEQMESVGSLSKELQQLQALRLIGGHHSLKRRLR